METPQSSRELATSSGMVKNRFATAEKYATSACPFSVPTHSQEAAAGSDAREFRYSRSKDGWGVSAKQLPPS